MTPNRDQAELIERVTDYLTNGGLFNPEMMPQGPACDLLIDCRLALSQHATRIAELLAADEQRARDISRLTVERDEARDRLATTQSELDEAREALEPFARADKALGDEPGPFRFETANGHRLIEREDFRRARAATRTAGGDNGE